MNLYKVPRLNGSKKSKGFNKNKNRNAGVFTAGRIILLAFLSLLFIFLLALYLFLNFYRPSAESVDIDWGDEFDFFIGGDPETEIGDMEPPVDLSGDRNPDCFTFLLLGTDSGVQTDTMLIAMLNTKENTMSVLSVPRDTYVTTKNFSGKITNVYGRGRVNAANAGTSKDKISEAGIEYLKKMIEYTFGIPIDKHILINLEGFKFLVDKIGGVDFDVPLRMKYTDPYQGLYIDLQKGFQPLDGSKAEQLIRFRQGDKGQPGYTSIGYPDADIGRIKTQQRFIAAVLKKMINPIDIKKIQSLLEAGSKYMVTNISTADAGWFAAKMTSVKLENIKTHTLPTNWINPYLYLYTPEAKEIINKYYNPYKKNIPESNFNIFYKDLSGLYKPEINIDGETMDKLVK